MSVTSDYSKYVFPDYPGGFNSATSTPSNENQPLDLSSEPASLESSANHVLEELSGQVGIDDLDGFNDLFQELIEKHSVGFPEVADLLDKIRIKVFGVILDHELLDKLSFPLTFTLTGNQPPKLSTWKAKLSLALVSIVYEIKKINAMSEIAFTIQSFTSKIKGDELCSISLTISCYQIEKEHNNVPASYECSWG